MWIGQPAYVGKVLEKFGMKDAKYVATPTDPSTKLMKAKDGEDREFTKQWLVAYPTCLLK